MSLSIHKLTLRRSEPADGPGGMAQLLERLAEAGADLQLVVGRRVGAENRALVELAPASGPRRTLDARKAPLGAGTPTLVVVGENRPGLARRIACALATSHTNLAFVTAQVVGGRYSGVFGFENEADLDKVADRVRAAAVARPIAAARSREPAGRS